MQRQSLLFPIFTVLLLVACGEPPVEPDAGICVPGTAGCPCLEGSICQGGLICEMSLCRGIDTVEVEVTDPAARSCEVILVEENTEVLGVEFAAGTLGTHVHESPRTAVTFSRQDDTVFAAGAVTVQRTEGAAGILRMRLARCFDRDGNVLGGDPLRVVD